jgi:predicted neutral ceramidase superfamily lipid hydrolase
MRYGQQKAGIWPISIIWRVDIICAFWFNLFWLSSLLQRSKTNFSKYLHVFTSSVYTIFVLATFTTKEPECKKKTTVLNIRKPAIPVKQRSAANRRHKTD